MLHSADFSGSDEIGGSDEDTYVEDRSGGLSFPVKCQQREWVASVKLNVTRHNTTTSMAPMGLPSFGISLLKLKQASLKLTGTRYNKLHKDIHGISRTFKLFHSTLMNIVYLTKQKKLRSYLEIEATHGRIPWISSPIFPSPRKPSASHFSAAT